MQLGSLHNMLRNNNIMRYELRWLLINLLLIVVIAALSGCSQVSSFLLPTSGRIEGVHHSHLTQHQPFCRNSTEYGTNSIEAVAHYQRGGFFVDVAEGYRVGGWEPGPREETTLRAGYEWRIKQ